MDIMKLHAILSKFHIWHDQNGAMDQQFQPTEVLIIICQKQCDAYLEATKHQFAIC